MNKTFAISISRRLEEISNFFPIVELQKSPATERAVGGAAPGHRPAESGLGRVQADRTITRLTIVAVMRPLDRRTARQPVRRSDGSHLRLLRVHAGSLRDRPTIVPGIPPIAMIVTAACAREADTKIAGRIHIRDGRRAPAIRDDLLTVSITKKKFKVASIDSG